MATQAEQIRELEERVQAGETARQVHETEDRLMFLHIRDSLLRVEAKVDKLGERLDKHSDEGKPPRGRWQMPDLTTLRNLGIGIGAVVAGASAYFGGKAVMAETPTPQVVEQAVTAPAPDAQP